MGAVPAGAREVYTFTDAEPSLYRTLAATAARLPESVAIVDDWGREVTFAQLLARVDDLAGYLVANAGCVPATASACSCTLTPSSPWPSTP